MIYLFIYLLIFFLISISNQESLLLYSRNQTSHARIPPENAQKYSPCDCDFHFLSFTFLFCSDHFLYLFYCSIVTPFVLLYIGLRDLLFDREKSFLATVAIDLGTTYSGFAFSLNKEQSENSMIFMNKDWVTEQGHRTSKTPTCLLLKPDRSFDSFGYKAVEKYANLRSVYEEKEFLFFQHFKMSLHNEEVRRLI